MFGCLLAGFYLLRVYDMATATFVAAAINVAVGVLALALARSTRSIARADEQRPSAPMRRAARGAVYVAIALSGLTALGAEVVWTRLLSLLFGATVYTFSIILAVFLVGLGIGSSVGLVPRARTRRPRVALGVVPGCC